MSAQLDRLLTALLVISAVVIAGNVTYRTFAPRSSAATISPPEYIQEWEDLAAVGVPVGGPDTAPIHIASFMDLECPVCMAFKAQVDSVRSDRPGQVRLTYIHYPLTRHRFALPAARAAECAREVDAFTDWVNAVYEKQDSLGLKSWASYASDAGITDAARIQRCAEEPRSNAAIDDGLALGNQLAVDGTPTVLINGWLYSYTPDRAAMNSAIDAILAGKSPR